MRRTPRMERKIEDGRDYVRLCVTLAFSAFLVLGGGLAVVMSPHHTAANDVVALVGVAVHLIVLTSLAVTSHGLQRPRLDEGTEKQRPRPPWALSHVLWAAAGLLLSLAAWVAVAWATGLWGWLAALVLPWPTGWAIALRIAAPTRALVTWRDIVDILRAGWIAPAAGAALGVAAWWQLGLWFYRQDWHTLLGWPLLLAGIAAGWRVGHVLAREHTAAIKLHERALAAVLIGKNGEAVLRTLAVRMDRATKAITITGPLSTRVTVKASELEDRLIEELPAYTVQTTNERQIVFVRAGKDVLARRELIAETDGLVCGEDPLPDAPAWRPDSRLWTLTSDAVAAGRKLGEVARQRGMALVEHRPEAREAVVAALDAHTVELRDALTGVLRGAKLAWDLDIAVTIGDVDTEKRVTSATVHRGPAFSTANDEKKAWLEAFDLLEPLPEWWEWRYTRDARARTITLTATLDPLRDVAPYDMDSLTKPVSPDTPWHVGVDEEGRAVEINLAKGAHMLIAGATRSGKSVCTYSLIAHVIRMGESARLLVADPNDTTAAPFLGKVSYATTDTTPAEPVEMLQYLRALMDERKPILRQMRADAVTTFTPDLPLIVAVIDEAANYMRSSEKDLAAEFNTELLAVVQQAAKYGIRIVLITQRPDSTILPTPIRSQLAARIAFRVEDVQTATMAFPDMEDPSLLLATQPGVGYVKQVGEVAPRRFRSLYLQDHYAAADRLPPMPKLQIGATNPFIAEAFEEAPDAPWLSPTPTWPTTEEEPPSLDDEPPPRPADEPPRPADEAPPSQEVPPAEESSRASQAEPPAGCNPFLVARGR